MEDLKKKTTILTLKNAAPLVHEIRYEKKDNDLVFYVSLKKDTKINVIVEDGEVTYKQLAPLGLLSKLLLSHIEYKPSSDLYISFATAPDFISCKATPKSLRESLGELRDCANQNSSFLILFESSPLQKTHGLLWSPKRDVREKALSLYRGTQRGNWALFFSRESLTLAKEKLQTVL